MKYKNNKSMKRKIFKCNICDRDDFINGHAVGGHKKYCGKEEYKKTKRRRLKKPKVKRIDFDTCKIFSRQYKSNKCVKEKQNICWCEGCIAIINDDTKHLISEMNNILKKCKENNKEIEQEIVDIIKKL
jgi:hypothetical protein